MKLYNPLIKLLLTGMVFLMSSPAMAVITGSAHDFKAQSWTGEICNVCHTPHNAIESNAGPLWDHALTATTNFVMYTSPTGTFDATIDSQPSGASKLCLSCHDGTVAVDSFGGTSGSTMIASINSAADFGTDLGDDHPISFVYDATLVTADGELWPVTTAALGGTIDNQMLFATKVECASCHDVHNKVAISNLLRIDNANSALCLTCHNK